MQPLLSFRSHSQTTLLLLPYYPSLHHFPPPQEQLPFSPSWILAPSESFPPLFSLLLSSTLLPHYQSHWDPREIDRFFLHQLPNSHTYCRYFLLNAGVDDHRHAFSSLWHFQRLEIVFDWTTELFALILVFWSVFVHMLSVVLLCSNFVFALWKTVSPVGDFFSSNIEVKARP
uniref:Uncharacterized protein n=1 Tax=Cucumis melo TaxID=3656 RepID=A0A9I9DYK2_CUCME